MPYCDVVRYGTQVPMRQYVRHDSTGERTDTVTELDFSHADSIVFNARFIRHRTETHSRRCSRCCAAWIFVLSDVVDGRFSATKSYSPERSYQQAIYRIRPTNSTRSCFALLTSHSSSPRRTARRDSLCHPQSAPSDPPGSHSTIGPVCNEVSESVLSRRVEDESVT